MYPTALSSGTLAVLDKLRANQFIEKFYLAGDAGLAFQLGHRKVQTLDFFIDTLPEKEKILQSFQQFNATYVDGRAGEVVVSIDNVRITISEYKYPTLKDFVKYENIKVACVLDIACMKLFSIYTKSSKKDFIDLYYIFRQFSLKELLTYFDFKFNNVEFKKEQLTKVLTAFDEADKEPDPDMLEPIEWEEIKSAIVSEIG